MSTLAICFSGTLLGFYINAETPNPDVVRYGQLRLTVIASTYLLCGVMDTLSYSVRGIGHSTLSMIVALIGACAFRIFWIFTVFSYDRSLITLYMSYPISWALTAAAHLVCFIIFFRREKMRCGGNLIKNSEI